MKSCFFVWALKAVPLEQIRRFFVCLNRLSFVLPTDLEANFQPSKVVPKKLKTYI